METMNFQDYFDLAKAGQPYGSQQAHWDDYLVFVDMLIRAALALKSDGGDTPAYLRGIGISHSEIDELLKASLLKNRQMANHQVCKVEIVKGLQFIFTREKATLEAGYPLLLLHIFSAYQLGSLESLAFLLAFAPTVHTKYQRLFGFLQDSLAKSQPGLSLVRGLFSLYSNENLGTELLRLRNAASAVRRELFQASDLEDPPLALKKRIILWLDTNDAISPDLLPVSQQLPLLGIDQPILVNQQIYDAFKRYVVTLLAKKKSSGNVVQLCGRSGSGRRFFISHLGGDGVCRTISVDFSQLCSFPFAKREMMVDELILEYKLSGRLVHLDIHPQAELTEEAVGLIQRLCQALPVVFISTSEKIKLPQLGNLRRLYISLELPLVSQRQLLWEAEAKKYSLAQDVDLSNYASKYALTCGDITQVLSNAQAEANYMDTDCLGNSHLVAAIFRQNRGALSELAVRIKPAFTWDDLIIEPEQKELLKCACNRLKYRCKVGEQWGFDKKVVYGRGVTLLLHGVPGTGKTMATQIIANETGMELYRIDLSQLNSKYIGETEKNISKLFDEAQGANVILFFDEADALFSKRTEIKNSNDKYANAETSFVLQRIEEFEGMSILSTNLFNNFDNAFIRRITYAVRFTLPDAKTRLKLWRSILPPQAPVDPSIDFAFLADNFELSGSAIKSVLYSAAFMAAQEGEIIAPVHVVKALKYELTKTSTIFSVQMLGKYAHLC